MIYGEYKQTEEYLNAEDVSLCVNGEDPVDEMYYPEELNHLPVIGIGYSGNELLIDIVCLNWDKRFEPDWIAQ